MTRGSLNSFWKYQSVDSTKNIFINFNLISGLTAENIFMDLTDLRVIFKWPRMTLNRSYKVSILSYLNGGFPERSSNIRQPRAHKSAVKSCPVFNRISGQTYSGVPQNVQVLFRWPIFFAKPKSTNLTYPRKLTGTNGYKRNLYRGYQWYRTTLDCIIWSLVDKH